MGKVSLGDGCKDKGIVIHELMHTLGFLHEHSRPDRDDYVEIIWENIKEKHKQNFEKNSQDEVQNGSIGYDYNSIMHYGENNFAKNRSIPTIKPLKENVTIGQRDGFSANDIEKILERYECGKVITTNNGKSTTTTPTDRPTTSAKTTRTIPTLSTTTPDSGKSTTTPTDRPTTAKTTRTTPAQSTTTPDSGKSTTTTPIDRPTTSAKTTRNTPTQSTTTLDSGKSSSVKMKLTTDGQNSSLVTEEKTTDTRISSSAKEKETTDGLNLSPAMEEETIDGRNSSPASATTLQTTRKIIAMTTETQKTTQTENKLKALLEKLANAIAKMAVANAKTPRSRTTIDTLALVKGKTTLGLTTMTKLAAASLKTMPKLTTILSKSTSQSDPGSYGRYKRNAPQPNRPFIEDDEEVEPPHVESRVEVPMEPTHVESRVEVAMEPPPVESRVEVTVKTPTVEEGLEIENKFVDNNKDVVESPKVGEILENDSKFENNNKPVVEPPVVEGSLKFVNKFVDNDKGIVDSPVVEEKLKIDNKFAIEPPKVEGSLRVVNKSVETSGTVLEDYNRRLLIWKNEYQLWLNLFRRVMEQQKAITEPIKESIQADELLVSQSSTEITTEENVTPTILTIGKQIVLRNDPKDIIFSGGLSKIKISTKDSSRQITPASGEFKTTGNVAPCADTSKCVGTIDTSSESMTSANGAPCTTTSKCRTSGTDTSFKSVTAVIKVPCASPFNCLTSKSDTFAETLTTMPERPCTNNSMTTHDCIKSATSTTDAIKLQKGVSEFHLPKASNSDSISLTEASRITISDNFKSISNDPSVVAPGSTRAINNIPLGTIATANSEAMDPKLTTAGNRNPGAKLPRKATSVNIVSTSSFSDISTSESFTTSRLFPESGNSEVNIPEGTAKCRVCLLWNLLYKDTTRATLAREASKSVTFNVMDSTLAITNSVHPETVSIGGKSSKNMIPTGSILLPSVSETETSTNSPFEVISTENVNSNSLASGITIRNTMSPECESLGQTTLGNLICSSSNPDLTIPISKNIKGNSPTSMSAVSLTPEAIALEMTVPNIINFQCKSLGQTTLGNLICASSNPDNVNLTPNVPCEGKCKESKPGTTDAISSEIVSFNPLAMTSSENEFSENSDPSDTTPDCTNSEIDATKMTISGQGLPETSTHEMMSTRINIPNKKTSEKMSLEVTTSKCKISAKNIAEKKHFKGRRIDFVDNENPEKDSSDTSNIENRASQPKFPEGISFRKENSEDDVVDSSVVTTADHHTTSTDILFDLVVDPREHSTSYHRISIYRPLQGRSVLSNPDRYWPNGIVPYEISEKYNEIQKGLILEGMEEFKKHTCVSFVERKDETETSFAFIEPEERCQSEIGRQAGATKVTLSEGCYLPGTIVHELMHVLGFYHEHCRPDRDSYVMVLWDNIIPEAITNFKKYPESIVSNLSVGYDYDSVMHYSAYEFARDPDKPTLVPLKPGVKIGEKDGFSKLDILKINKLYNCSTIIEARDEGKVKGRKNDETEGVAELTQTLLQKLLKYFEMNFQRLFRSILRTIQRFRPIILSNKLKEE
ncbi:uncharacterized protein LOC129981378 [Argiope bruennichi]|uniref:uncharacterized protein LOC129981378 n=1 Tax=Argiope bruennichi TaxID=94029 RepID=UPI002495A6AA|nr:uncharacterized protein LOC129981378 [Argiope bruennichi]